MRQAKEGPFYPSRLWTKTGRTEKRLLRRTQIRAKSEPPNGSMRMDNKRDSELNVASTVDLSDSAHIMGLIGGVLHQNEFPGIDFCCSIRIRYKLI